jgi:hypothetical protein
MITTRGGLRSRAFSVLLSLLLLALGGPLAAVPATAQDVEVTSADPPAAPQGTLRLDVSIKGKGFKKGAAARFFSRCCRRGGRAREPSSSP